MDAAGKPASKQAIKHNGAMRATGLRRMGRTSKWIVPCNCRDLVKYLGPNRFGGAEWSDLINAQIIQTCARKCQEKKRKRAKIQRKYGLSMEYERRARRPSGLTTLREIIVE